MCGTRTVSWINFSGNRVLFCCSLLTLTWTLKTNLHNWQWSHFPCQVTPSHCRTQVVVAVANGRCMLMWIHHGPAVLACHYHASKRHSCLLTNISLWTRFNLTLTNSDHCQITLPLTAIMSKQHKLSHSVCQCCCPVTNHLYIQLMAWHGTENSSGTSSQPRLLFVLLLSTSLQFQHLWAVPAMMVRCCALNEQTLWSLYSGKTNTPSMRDVVAVFKSLGGWFWGFLPHNHKGNMLHQWGWNLAWRSRPKGCGSPKTKKFTRFLQFQNINATRRCISHAISTLFAGLLASFITGNVLKFGDLSRGSGL